MHQRAMWSNDAISALLSLVLSVHATASNSNGRAEHRGGRHYVLCHLPHPQTSLVPCLNSFAFITRIILIATETSLFNLQRHISLNNG